MFRRIHLATANGAFASQCLAPKREVCTGARLPALPHRVSGNNISQPVQYVRVKTSLRHDLDTYIRLLQIPALCKRLYISYLLHKWFQKTASYLYF